MVIEDKIKRFMDNNCHEIYLDGRYTMTFHPSELLDLVLDCIKEQKDVSIADVYQLSEELNQAISNTTTKYIKALQ